MRYVTVTLMTLISSRTAVETKSNRNCNHRFNDGMFIHSESRISYSGCSAAFLFVYETTRGVYTCMLQLVLDDGRLTLNVSSSTVNRQLNIGDQLNDGEWHDVRLLVQDGSVATLSLSLSLTSLSPNWLATKQQRMSINDAELNF